MKRLFFYLILMMPVMALSAEKMSWALTNINASLVRDFHDGMAIVANYTSGSSSKKYGAVDTDGRLVIPYKFDELSDFAYGVAIAKIDGKYGVINKNGNYILAPSVNYHIYNVTHEVNNESVPIDGLFRIYDAESKQYGCFFKNKIIVPISEKGLKTTVVYPFCIIPDDNNKFNILNLETGEIHVGAKVEKDDGYTHIQYITPDKREMNKYYDNVTGVEIFPQFEINGSKVVTNENGSSLWINHEKIISEEERFIFLKPYFLYGYISAIRFRGDSAIERVYQSISSKPIIDKKYNHNEITYICSMYPAKGKNVSSEANNDLVLGELTMTDNDISFTNYLYKGTTRLYKGGTLSFITNNFFYDPQKSIIINTEQNKKYSSSVPIYSDGMIVGENDHGVPFILNVSTGKATYKEDFSKIYPFHEGLAVAETKKDQKVVIDKKGNIIIQDYEHYRIKGEQFSEGVIAVSYDYNTYGYVYNPLTHGGEYKYNVKNRNTFLFQKGIELYNNGKYAKAKDYFYSIMINDPTHVDGIMNYGCCLERLGYYDSAIDAFITVLKIDPDNKEASNNLQITRNNKIIAEQEQQYRTQQMMMVFDGLTQFFNVLGETASQYASFSSEINSSRESGYSSQGSSYSAHNTSGQTPDQNMSKNRDARTYSDLESQLIKMHTYPNTYNDNQRRSIQSQMRSIRTKWESKGFNMFHSQWEDWDGSSR